MSYQKRMDHLTALPSVSYQLSSLPQAKSLDHVALHQPTLASHLPAQEAKLRKALSVTSQNSANGQQQIAIPLFARILTSLMRRFVFTFPEFPELGSPLPYFQV